MDNAKLEAIEQAAQTIRPGPWWINPADAEAMVRKVRVLQRAWEMMSKAIVLHTGFEADEFIAAAERELFPTEKWR